MDQETKAKSASPQPNLPSKISNENLQRENNPISRKLNKILESRIENDKVRFNFKSKKHIFNLFICRIFWKL